MEYIVQRIFLDMHTVSSQVSLRVKKGDTNRKICATLREGSKPYQIADDCVAVFSARKTDGNYIYNDCSIESNTIAYTFTEQTVPVVGAMDCEITLYNAAGQVITSPRFTMIVEDRVYNDEEIVSSSEANQLIALLDHTNDVINNVLNQTKQAIDDVEDSTSAAINEAESKTNDAISRVNGAMANINTTFANAFKGSKSGAVVQADDVSPVEHIVGCKVRNRNFFNTSDDYNGYDYTYVPGTLTITGRYVHKYITLEEGKTYTFSCKSTRTGTEGGGVYIAAYMKDKSNYVIISAAANINIVSPTVTITVPVGYPIIRFTLYGYYTSTGSGTATYTELMLEEGSEATGYVPYVSDLSTVKVSRCGRNLLPYPYTEQNFSGTYVSFTVNEDRSVTLKGTNPTAATQFDLASELILPPGTYSFAGYNSNVRARILGVDGSSRYSVDTFTVSEGEKVRIYVVALANEETDFTFYPMLNAGSEALQYEEYVGGTCSVNTDGTVNGMTSLYPYMTVFTDTTGAIVTCQYNRDSNKVYEELYNFLEQGGLIKPKRIAYINVLASAWVDTGSGVRFTQTVAVDGITPDSQIDIKMTGEQLEMFYDINVTIVAENNNGVVIVSAIGDKPTEDFTLQATITEVEK